MPTKKIKSQPLKAGIRTTKYFTDPAKAHSWISDIYECNTHYLQECFHLFSTEDNALTQPVRACYPYVQVTVKDMPKVDSRRAYGFLTRPGVYRTTVTRPDIFDYYYQEQFSLLLGNHKLKIEVGVSETPIPLHFALGEHFHLEADLSGAQMSMLPNLFDLPDLANMDDSIPNGDYEAPLGGPYPLALFTAPRVDLSIQRLKHYTATSGAHFQNFVLYTNYQFYIDQFIQLGRQLMTKTDDADVAAYRSEYTAFVEPGDKITYNANIEGVDKDAGQPAGRLPQMPAYHLKRADGSGITMINIGVGPSNAKTITDHVAVLRPHAWLMLGHCAGLRNSQSLGDYVLAHAYVREDGVLDEDLPIWVPLPALAEIQVALQRAVSEVTGLGEYEFKQVMRTGTVATINDRNWELKSQRIPVKKLSQCRAVALDMESATIAANGFRFRVPYGTLLCVSDKPLHGQLKLPGMADKFYRERVDQHLKIGILAMEKLRNQGIERLHSRKLRSFTEVAFQ
jgi:AMP nucleosidase